MIKFDQALIVSHYFGFIPIAAPQITERDVELTRQCGDFPYYDASEKLAVIRTYLEQNFTSLPHPLALAYKRSPSRKTCGYALHFIGSPSGIAEATLIRTTFSILSESGHRNLKLEINCVGDKESINTYERELINCLRRSGANLPDQLRRAIKTDIFNLFRLENPEILRLRALLPSAITFLSTQSRIYFKEVLEYIEALGIEFALAPELVGERNHASHTIFAVKNSDNEERGVLAVGYRYSRLARFLGLRKEIPMAGVTIFTDGKGSNRERMYKELPKPKFYLIQLGQEAKIKTLSLIETLRVHRIPVHHFLGKDQITVQLANAENLCVPYLIIIGQKEALDNTATIRNVATRAQDTVSMTNLPHYLKHIRL